MSKKFTITMFNTDGKNRTITVGNPKDGIVVADVTAFRQAFDEFYSEENTLRKGKYVVTSETVVYPAS